MFGGIYFPNEKIAFLIVVSSALIGLVQVKKKEFVNAITLVSILAVLTCIRILMNGSFSITDLNTIVFIFGLPFYIAFFDKFREEFVKVFSAVVFFNLMASLFQQICLLNNLTSIAMYFNNYPMQADYIYPKGLNIFYRTSGLFNESSQYSIFLISYIFLYLHGGIKKNKYNFLILIVSIIDVLINESATAYIAFAFILILYLYRSINLYGIKILFIFLLVILIITIPEYMNSFIDKFINTYNRQEYYPRLDNMLAKIVKVTNDSPFIGLGFTLELPSWDFISVYYYAYGALGLFSLVFYFSTILFKYNSIFLIIIFINSFVAGNILISVNLVLLLILIHTHKSKL